ncbi:hypothetical protein BDA96_03G160500 [Sorghum bicolor]|uniref:Uncharacterized protein n=1 Tax=Sorghum bicolor TaxID=4558 RepID=A0A921RBS9_SORBI|nr:hypothetical protein BDA96_03G160500 [Sorghum bicolor]
MMMSSLCRCAICMTSLLDCMHRRGRTTTVWLQWPAMTTSLSTRKKMHVVPCSSASVWTTKKLFDLEQRDRDRETNDGTE